MNLRVSSCNLSHHSTPTLKRQLQKCPIDLKRQRRRGAVLMTDVWNSFHGKEIRAMRMLGIAGVVNIAPSCVMEYQGPIYHQIRHLG